jgi:hypothetical protein
MSAFNTANTFSNSLYLFDGISPFEAVYFLLKKSIGYPDTIPRGSVTGEVTNNFNSYPFITLSKQYNQQIPPLNPKDFILDPSWSNFGYRTPYKSGGFSSDSVSRRYYSSNYPYIALYSNLVLTFLSVESSVNNLVSGPNYPSYGHPLLVNAIPTTFINDAPSNIYSWKLRNSNGTNINDTDGFWLCDTDSGVITFFDSNTTVSQITNTNPPNFTFYRYEGLIGTTNVATTQDL